MNVMEVWGVEETETSEVSLEAINTLIQNLKENRDKKEVLEAQISELSQEKEKLEQKLIEYLKDNGMTSFKGPHGQIVINKRKRVNQPATPEDKAAFFSYLKEQGLFEAMVSVNSNTLSSWAVSEIESKKKEGVFGWVPPGLKEPSEYESISLRKA